MSSDLLPLDEVAALLSSSMTREGISVPLLVRKVLLDPNYRREGAFIERVSGRVAGFCLAIARQVPLENAPSDADRGYITLLGVHPSHRGRGIGTTLVGKAEEFLRNDGRKTVMISSYAPNYFIPGVDVGAYAEGHQFLLARGYQEVYRPLAMQTDLWDLTAPEWVLERDRHSAIEMSPWQPEIATPLLDFVREHFPGDWVRVVRETTRAILDGDRPTRLWTARVDGQVVGFAHFEGERFGPIGVSTAHRGKGIGQLLALKILRSQQEAGCRCSWFLWSDDRTAARLYDGFAFREIRRFALMRKQLA